MTKLLRKIRSWRSQFRYRLTRWWQTEKLQWSRQVLRVPQSERTDSSLPFSLSRAEDGQTPTRMTYVRVAHHNGILLVSFNCEGNPGGQGHLHRDEPLWEDETVQVFLAPGAASSKRYVEIEVNPRGTTYDAVILNPIGIRSSIAADTTWSCKALKVYTSPTESGWRADLEIPLQSVAKALGISGVKGYQHWVGNFFRIHRPSDSPAEFTSWNPTLASPADFHRPEKFGLLRLEVDRPRTDRAKNGILRLEQPVRARVHDQLPG